MCCRVYSSPWQVQYSQSSRLGVIGWGLLPGQLGQLFWAAGPGSGGHSLGASEWWLPHPEGSGLVRGSCCPFSLPHSATLPWDAALLCVPLLAGRQLPLSGVHLGWGPALAPGTAAGAFGGTSFSSSSAQGHFQTQKSEKSTQTPRAHPSLSNRRPISPHTHPPPRIMWRQVPDTA